MRGDIGCMFITGEQNAGKNHYIRKGNASLENVAKFGYLVAALADQI
jgi:hypothetical protein